MGKLLAAAGPTELQACAGLLLSVAVAALPSPALGRPSAPPTIIRATETG
jgi:hypothetical protein